MKIGREASRRAECGLAVLQHGNRSDTEKAVTRTTRSAMGGLEAVCGLCCAVLATLWRLPPLLDNAADDLSANLSCRMLSSAMAGTAPTAAMATTRGVSGEDSLITILVRLRS